MMNKLVLTWKLDTHVARLLIIEIILSKSILLHAHSVRSLSSCRYSGIVYGSHLVLQPKCHM